MREEIWEELYQAVTPQGEIKLIGYLDLNYGWLHIGLRTIAKQIDFGMYYLQEGMPSYTFIAQYKNPEKLLDVAVAARKSDLKRFFVIPPKISVDHIKELSKIALTQPVAKEFFKDV